MRNPNELLNSKKGKIILWLLMAVLMLLAIFIAIKLTPKSKDVNQILDSGENVLSGDTVESGELSGVLEERIKILSGDSYEINKDAGTITFNGDIPANGSFCITANPDGPSSGDEWIPFDENNSYNFSNNDIDENDDEAKKVYCIIATGESALYANIMLQKGVVVD